MKYGASSSAFSCRLVPFNQVKSPKANGSLAWPLRPGQGFLGGLRRQIAVGARGWDGDGASVARRGGHIRAGSPGR